MSLFAIGDLHLALGAPEKNMEVFGGRWVGYTDKIRRGFDLVREEDLCVICGDTSWAMDLESALPDFQFLQSLPGKKILISQVFSASSTICRDGSCCSRATTITGGPPRPR